MVDFFLFGVLTPVAFDFDDQVQQVVLTVTVIHQHDEIGEVFAGLGTIAVRHFQTEIVIFDIGLDPRMRFRHAAEFGLPVAVENHPVDMAAAGVGLPAVGFGGVEVDMDGGAGRDCRDQARP